ncbi:hypothetical protein EON80_05815 [bacterium]|nr:MAG: hypothetical protein EON80_05815 [bacterium]
MVGGTNGEVDDLTDRAALDRRLLTQPPVEAIGEQSFSLWKVESPLRSPPPTFTRGFVPFALVGSFVLIGLGAWIANRIRSGDFLAGQIFAVAVMGLMFLGPVVAIALSKRAHKKKGPPEAPPIGVPAKAIVTLASVSTRGRSVGWLWLDGDVMHFRGYGFDFRLRREDFTMKGPIIRAWRGQEGARLRRPDGISHYILMLFPGELCGDTFARDPKLWKELIPDLQAWESGTHSTAPSLFPPIRPVPSLRHELTWRRLVAPPVFMAVLLGFAGLALPVDTSGRTVPPAVFFAAIGIGFGLLWDLIVWMTYGTSRATDREVDKAILRAKGNS